MMKYIEQWKREHTQRELQSRFLMRQVQQIVVFLRAKALNPLEASLICY